MGTISVAKVSTNFELLSLKLPTVRISNLKKAENAFRIKKEDQVIIVDVVSLKHVDKWLEKMFGAYPALNDTDKKRLELIQVAAAAEVPAGQHVRDCVDNESQPPRESRPGKGRFDFFFAFQGFAAANGA